MGALLVVLILLQTASALAGSADIRCPGVTKFTQYFIKDVVGPNDRACTDEGSCRFQNKDGEWLIKDVKEAPVLAADTACKFGRGINDACLMPCESIAADLRYHSFGDIIYISEFAGLKCGQFENKNGRFFVNDRGRDVKGKNRFDVFIGDCMKSKDGDCSDPDQQDIKLRVLTNKVYCKDESPQS